MIRFDCDYTEGACEEILNKLKETNMEQTPGYGEDKYCDEARKKIREICECPEATVEFLIGGTQTNMIVISSILKPYQGVIAADEGHISVHEAGAIETTGHKVLEINTRDGKITPRQVKEICENHFSDDKKQHTVQPGMVYISQPTENGLLYTKKELEELYNTCKDCNLPLYIDGARLGYGMMSPKNDMYMSDIARNCDVFYIGGTKIGALFGEAVVIVNKNLQRDFRYNMKQKGGLLAKGRLLGIQFCELFSNNLYFNISKHAIDMAMRIKEAFNSKGYNLFYDSYTNQQFPILPNDLIKELSNKYELCFWKKFDENNSVVRICTSWATASASIEQLINDIR